MGQRTEKTGADLQAKGIDKQYKAEIARVIQYGLINADSDMTCKDSHEKHKCHPERDSGNLDFTQDHARRADKAEHYHRL